MSLSAPHLVEVDLGPGVRAGFTTAPANLSLVVGERQDRARDHRDAVRGWAGAPVAYVRQVHGADVHVVTPPTGGGPARDGTVGSADAVVVHGPAAAAAVLVADCVPVLLADAAAGVVGAVHAGRRGLVADVLRAAVSRMAGLGAHPERVRAVVGPAICGRCYEVPSQMRDDVDGAVPGTATETSWGTPAIDLRAGVHVRLGALGVTDVADLEACTRTDDRWFSHRASAESARASGLALRPDGRFAGVVRLLPA